MRTNNITKWATLLTVSGLLTIIAPLTVTAQYLIVNSNTVVSGTHYENGPTVAALTISNNTYPFTFTGSDVTLTGTATSGNGRIGANIAGMGVLNLTDSVINAVYTGVYITATAGPSSLNNTNITVTNAGSTIKGVYLNRGVISITGGTITLDAASGALGVHLINASSGTLNHVSVATTGASSHGIDLEQGSTLSVTGGTVQTNGLNSNGFYLTGTSAATLDGVNILTSGSTSHGVNMSASSTLTMTGGTITTGTTGANGINAATASVIDVRDTAINTYAVGVSLTGTSKATLENVNITTRNNNAYGIDLGTSSTASFSGTIITNGASAHGVRVNGTSTLMIINNASILTNNTGAYGADIYGASALAITGGTIHTVGNSANGLNLNGTSVATFNNVNIIAEGTSAYGISINNSSTLTMTGGAVTGAKIGVQVSSSGYFHGTNVAVTSLGNGIENYGMVIQGSGTIVFIGGTIRTSGSLVHGAHVGGVDNGESLMALIGADVQTTGVNAAAVHLDAPGSTFTKSALLDGGTYASAQGSGLAVNQLVVGGNGSYSTGVFDITIKGGATVSGTSSVLIGGSVVKDAPAVTINVSEASTLLGDVNTVINGTTTLNLSDSSTLIGNVNAKNATVLTVTLNNSVLTGASDVADTATLSVSLNNNANWNMTGRSWVTNLHGANGGTITIDNVQGEDLIVKGSNGVSGITGETKLNLTLSDSVKGDQEIWVVVDETNAMTGECFTLGREVSAGMYQYELVNATDGAWLVYTGSGTPPPVNPPVDPLDPTDPPVVPPVTPPVPPTPPTISSEGDAVINTAAAVAGFWFTQLDNLHKRMGELRYNKPAGGDLINNIWIRAYGQQINANTGIYSVKGFAETQYGVDLGTDYLWKLDADNLLYTGIFAGYGGADRDFHTNYNGSTDSGYGGLYATWINADGWYADAVAKGQYFRNEFSGEDRAAYDSVGVGVSLEVGKMFEFKHGWFVEPSVQFSYLHLMNDNYTTRDGMGVTLSDADVLHIYGGARFGRNIKLSNSGMLQPYIKAGGLGQISSGNKVTVDGDHWRPNLDGARAVVGAGLIWQLDADSQLHLDYEASFGEKYDKPWGVNFGYRYQF